MENIKEFFSNTLDRIVIILSGFDSITDLLDILLVTIIIYYVIVQLRRTQSIQIIKGVVFVAVIYFLVSAWDMQASKYIFDSLLGNIIFVFVIIFNTEIRQALEHIGQSKFRRITIFSSPRKDDVVVEAINATCRACAAMSEDNIGSLIIFQRNTFLGEITKSSVDIDSVTTTEMLCSIFFPNSALHDGAIIISEGRIIAARCIIPLKNDKEINESFGTRHRAALEITRASDAVAVVTSEESGMISIAEGGVLTRGISDSELRRQLTDLLIESGDEDNSKGISAKFKRFFKGGKKND